MEAIIGGGKMKNLLWKLMPRIYNLPEVIYVRWLDFEWIIRKVK